MVLQGMFSCLTRFDRVKTGLYGLWQGFRGSRKVCYSGVYSVRVREDPEHQLCIHALKKRFFAAGSLR